MSISVAGIDLGATSGRVVVGRVGENELSMQSVARFPNTPVQLRDGLHWDVLALYKSVLDGLTEASRFDSTIRSIGIDSWAVDYALMRSGRMLNVPYHYRDTRTSLGVREVEQKYPHRSLFERNGLQFLPFNTLYQLSVDRSWGTADIADTALLIPDLFAYWLTGEMRTEITNASTTGLLDAKTLDWDVELFAELGLPRNLWPQLIHPGERVGPLSNEIASQVGLTGVDVVAVGSHDTASAVVAVPLTSQNSAYISCGTWGLVGLELSRPILSDEARKANFTNELGVDGRTRFLHNVMGLWLLSESIRAWSIQGLDIDLPTLLDEAGEVRGDIAVFDVNDPVFLSPGDMPKRIAAWCRDHDQPIPQSKAEFARSIVESLAQAFVNAVLDAQKLSGVVVDVIHVVGGGSQNNLLCQRIADRSGLNVLAGPVEATALGNILIQARALDEAPKNLEELRDLVRRTHLPVIFTPKERKE